MLRLKIRKTTFKEKEAWLVFEDDGNNYCGTWHTHNERIVDYIRLKKPIAIDFIDSVENKNG